MALGPALSVFALLLPLAAAAAPRPPVTQAESGKSFRLAKGASLTLHLSERWLWTEPRPSSRAVQLTPIEYFVDPGYRGWEITARAHGTVTIRSSGKPACSGCGLSARSFRVTILAG